MAETQLLRLPWELMLNVMACYLPLNPTTLIPTSDNATQLLLDFSTVNRVTREFAVRKIQQHCIVLDTDDKLRRFLLCLELSRRPKPFDIPSVFHNIHTMYLAPFGLVMDNLPTAMWIRDIFGYTSESLKRLIVDMPFDSLPPWNDHLNVGPVLLEGFERLGKLEEFVCTRNAARLSVRHEDGSSKSILYRWPNLRRLGLNRPLCDTDFWECLADLPHLEHAIFAGAMSNLGGGSEFREVYTQRASPASRITLVLAEVREFMISSTNNSSESIGSIEEDDRIRLMAYKIRIPPRKNFLDSNSEWLMGTALAGELWDIQGQRFIETPQLLVPHPQVAELE
ncbi:hypothetical protein BKA67DRAFT_541160 [Truncatella angustata]|uniref:Uncharacterized protein n=1 Tax=Truncatella angustata TaxID=152316 RepID=A0A9P8RHL9_9PEZI|nr:uncharacterized protein BKA67DRAFT_541160 [Truncatella angustata]KAH6646178.1 hypothetical protein BKA67DRAFT_541160 [Truncatella angustata]